MNEVQELKLQILSDYRNLLSVAQLDLLRVQLGLLVDAAAQQKSMQRTAAMPRKSKSKSKAGKAVKPANR